MRKRGRVSVLEHGWHPGSFADGVARVFDSLMLISPPSLLSDLRTFTAIPFTHILSSEMFGTYKPSPEVYLGAVKALGVAPAECVMVAAHLADLKAAKENGLQTIYVERAGEEDWSDEEIQKARSAGWVDLWVDLREGNRGFITVAEKLGITVAEGDATTRLSSSLPVGMD
jgi:2-haloacid dehalogenase